MTSSVQQPASSNGSGPGLPPALELRDVTGGYGQTTVLRGVSITVPASGVVALLGPNGAGKTTLLKTVSGFLRPSSGSILLFGNDAGRRDGERYTAQDRGLPVAAGDVAQLKRGRRAWS